MVARAMAVPILPGKVEAWRSFWAHWLGPGKAEYEEVRRRAGITREVICLQHTSQGDVAVVYVDSVYERDEMIARLQVDTPFITQFLQMIKDVHGFDQPPSGPLSEPIFDWRA